MTQVEIAAARLYGPGGLGATNVKFFPTDNPNVTAEQIAGQLNRVLDNIEAGDFEMLPDVD